MFIRYSLRIPSSTITMRLSTVDPCSYSTPETEVIEHIDLDWFIDFERHVIGGKATYLFKIVSESVETIVSLISLHLCSIWIRISCTLQFLDVYDIDVRNVTVKTAEGDIPVNYFISDHVKRIGSKLTIELPTKTSGQ